MSSNSASDRRKSPRLPVNLHATYRSENLILDGYISNISQSGLLIRCNDCDSVGSAAEVVISLPEEAKPVVVSGRVAWARLVEAKMARMGITLDPLPFEVRRTLANFLLRSNFAQNTHDST